MIRPILPTETCDQRYRRLRAANADQLARALLAARGYYPDETGRYWGWDGDDYRYQSPRELLAICAPGQCALVYGCPLT